MELKKGRFYNVILKCGNFASQARAKDVDIVELSKEDKSKFNYDDISPTHTLLFYDCTCGGRKEIPGIIEKNENNEIIFAVSKEKKFIIREITA